MSKKTINKYAFWASFFMLCLIFLAVVTYFDRGYGYMFFVFIILSPFMSYFLWIMINCSIQDQVEQNKTKTSQNQVIHQNNPSLSPNMSEVVKLTKQVESIKDSFKVINYEVDDSIFVKFEFLKDTVYARINKIDWQNNNNPELVKKYQAVVDGYVKKLDNEYLNIKKQFDDIVDNDVKHEIENVNLID